MHRLTVSALVVAATTTWGQAARPQDPLALINANVINANVINVNDGTVQRNVTVVLRAGRIESVSAAAAAPAGVQVIDAHVHKPHREAHRATRQGTGAQGRVLDRAD